jgi:peptidoglycan hydrolase-like protein with peptidoglycan-binding domain
VKMTALEQSTTFRLMRGGSALVRGQTTVLGLIARRVARRPGKFVMMAGVCALGSTILVNALALQPERHPAPLFTGSVAIPQSAQVPLPPTRNVEARASEAVGDKARRDAVAAELQGELKRRGFFVPAAPGQTGMTLETAIRDYQEAAGLRIDGQATEGLLALVKASKLKMSDQILQILKPGSQGPEPSRNVLFAQRSLNKAGYGPLKEDGMMGAGTKAAIERFEKDRKLPVKGEPQGRVLRELASVSGLPND